jgi:putative transposase
MQNYFLTPQYKRVERVRRRAAELSERENNRLRAIEVWQKTSDAEFVCKTFEMSRATLYRWIARFDPRNILSLREKSRRPKNVRKPLWPVELIKAVKQLRNQYPRWGKEKLEVLLRKQGFQTSASSVGRILSSLKKRGALIEPKPNHISAHKKHPKRPYAIRKPKDFLIQHPGDLVQLDTLDIRPLPDVVLKQFTARDYISRWDVCEVHSRATAKTATSFLDTLQARMPFPIKAIQIDGGSEFFSEFEQQCQKREILLFVLPPKSPKLNGRVERANRTHTEEFYEVTPVGWTVTDVNRQLIAWEKIYNLIRPHQALGYLTPAEFLNLNRRNP